MDEGRGKGRCEGRVGDTNNNRLSLMRRRINI